MSDNEKILEENTILREGCLLLIAALDQFAKHNNEKANLHVLNAYNILKKVL